jgi:DME family drug/metabolite transporter
VRRLSADHSSLLIAGLGLVVTALILAPATLALTSIDWARLSASATDWRSLGVLLYLGLGPTALAYICYCTGMARCRSAVVGLVASMIEPAVAAGLAFLFLQESLSAWEVMGCVLLFFAMLTLWLEENEPRSATSSGIRPASQAG